MKFVTLALLAVFISPLAQADPPALRDRQTGKYLGNLSANPYDSNSVNNPFGRYGSPYSADSINNPYGQYGSRYSNDSPNNPYATNGREYMGVVETTAAISDGKCYSAWTRQVINRTGFNMFWESWEILPSG
ncbi:hypothetical protein SAMN05216412_101223 [Nitrosospira multiformis]|uniref:Uncharacterized protein n=1 Tax=Nitrosospira multiformis TaxID=1231 RepID=A0A1H9YGV1_9PROT|nr:hypothetical protein [Nitrosospira multiformis]SES68270.1 hypothetical protein SAMN05216412_101223 [Nitrosospira multiformis]